MKETHSDETKETRRDETKETRHPATSHEAATTEDATPSKDAGPAIDEATQRGTSNALRFALAVVVVHAIVTSLHGAAHQKLGIEASPAQTFFIVAVIWIAPLVAGVLLWKRARQAGALALVLSMVGAFLFGVYHHFVANSADHVSHVAATFPGAWATLFQTTAVLLALCEALGTAAGMSVLRETRARS